MAKGIYPYYRPIASGQDPIVTMADRQKVLMFGSNSYLGLSDDPRLKEAAIAAIKRELGAKWAVSVVFWQCLVAWLASLAVYQIGSLLF